MAGCLAVCLSMSLLSSAALAAEAEKPQDTAGSGSAVTQENPAPEQQPEQNPDATTSGDTDQDASTPGDTDQDASVPGDTNQDTATPGDTDQDASAPGDSDPDAATPGDTDQDASAPGETDQDTATPGDTDQDASAPGDTDQDASTPGDTGSDTEEPPVPDGSERRLTPADAVVTPGSLTTPREHVPYIVGFPDGTFLPEKQLTRAETIQLLSRLVTTVPAETKALPYDDVVPGAWYEPSISLFYSLGLLGDSAQLHPDDVITRAEFVDLLVLTAGNCGRLSVPVSQPAEDAFIFNDVFGSYWASAAIQAAVTAGWVGGFPDGTFRPDQGLTRAEMCKAVNNAFWRLGDVETSKWLLDLGLFTDVASAHWASASIAEAAVEHGRYGDTTEHWLDVDVNKIPHNTAIGFHSVGDKLYYTGRDGKIVTNQMLGAYSADAFGVLTLTSNTYQMSYVPYISQIDGIYAWVGCEPVSALMGLKAKGFAKNVTTRAFLDNLPTTTSNPEKGFVGSPYTPDHSKRTTIYPAKLAEYCNTYTNGMPICADFRGASVADLQRELLAGNPVVAYESLWWKPLYYRNYNIEGQTQRLVSNNHAILVYGYDPQKGYLVSDPYNYYNRGQVYQYWEAASTFENIWNQRKVGMVIR